MASIHSRDSSLWTKAIVVYEKVNGQWVKKLDESTALEDDIIYIPLTALGLLIDEETDYVVIGDDRVLV